MVRIFNIAFISADVARLGRFWQGVTGYAVVEAGDDLVRLRATEPASPDLLLLRSDTPSSGGGRVHLDLAVDDVPAEIERLIGLGATLADGGTSDEPVARTSHGISWVVLLDPDGNEVCVGGLPDDGTRVAAPVDYASTSSK